MTAMLHIYVTDGHEGAGWNKQGVTHRIDTKQVGASDGKSCHRSYASALDTVRSMCALCDELGETYKVHDLTAHGRELQRYRDGRAIHVATLKRWKAALRSTTGNPRMVVLAHLGESEVRRDAVVTAIAMARQALAGLRDMRHGRAPLI